MNATYGGLLAAAADAVADANLAVGHRRFDSQLDAAQALVDYRGLLDALAGHTWVLLTPEQAAGVRASQGPHRVEVGAIAMAEAIDTLAGTGRPHPALHTEPVTSWARAARCLTGQRGNGSMACSTAPTRRLSADSFSCWSPLASPRSLLSSGAALPADPPSVISIALGLPGAFFEWAHQPLPAVQPTRSEATGVDV